MTNCPNCGAPYKPGIPVCEYCGTPREGLDADSMSAINAAVGRAQIIRELCDLEQQNEALRVSMTFNAMLPTVPIGNPHDLNGNQVCGFEQMRLNAETGRIGAFPHTPLTIEHRRKKLLKSAFSIQFYTWLACLSGLTLILPNVSFLCYYLAGKPSIVAEVLGILLLPLLVSLNYVIALRGLKRAYRGC